MTQPNSPDAADRLLDEALSRRASDVHLEPTAAGYELRYRIDGVLQLAGRMSEEEGRRCVTRLMVAAQLLTYRLDVPQEGRLPLRLHGHEAPVQTRLAIMPTTHGLRAAVRMPAELLQPRTLDDLGLPPAVLSHLRTFAAGDSGMLVLAGPAGAGKTTAVYALLEHIVAASPGVSVISLEDPVERDVPGVTQIEVRPFGELTYARALRSILRQDPQVLALGEVRDAETAALAVQAALSGHRLVTTLHAGTPEAAIVRLIEMGLERYQVASAVWGVAALRLLRRREGEGYRGRVPAAVVGRVDDEVRRAILDGGDAVALRRAMALQSSYGTLHDAAAQLVEGGVTDQAEVDRVLGCHAGPESAKVRVEVCPPSRNPDPGKTCGPA